MNFVWKLSYHDEKEYEVYGATSLRRIEMYGASEHTLEYMASIYNYTPEQFRANIIARQSGCVVRYRDGNCQYPYRWAEDEYQAFADFLKRQYEEDEKITQEFREKYPGVNFSDPTPFVAPVPMFYDLEAKTYKPEPFYQMSVNATSITDVQS